MHWLLIGYMFLFIHRPFEVWPWLGELHVERVYMLLTLATWLIWPGKRWLPNWQHLAYAAFGGGVFAAWLMSPWADAGQPVVEDYFKIVIFYFLLVTSVHDEKGLRRMIVGFLAVMSLYMMHSLREYFGGRHTFRMGIARMIGVDTSLGDPNSFAASIVFALAFLPSLWRGGFNRLAILGYFGLSTLCILLTGSRSGLLGLGVWCLFLTVSIRRGWLAGLGLLMLSPAIYVALPESLQIRFETIVNPEVGTEIERQSGAGRILGFFTGLDLWATNPLTGIGPGAWRPATGSTIESHNLYGQLVGETGTLGLLGFLAVLWMLHRNLKAMRRQRADNPEIQGNFAFLTARAVGIGVLLLLVMGCFGHNLFRFTWLWYGGFLIIARHVAESQAAEVNSDIPMEIEEQLPADWTWHPPHRATVQPVPG